MKIELLSAVGIDGKKLKPGTVIEMPFLLGKDLVHRGRAREVADEKKAAVFTDSGPTFLADTSTRSEANEETSETPPAPALTPAKYKPPHLRK